jgi:hypothetical protein
MPSELAGIIFLHFWRCIDHCILGLICVGSDLIRGMILGCSFFLGRDSQI